MVKFWLDLNCNWQVYDARHIKHKDSRSNDLTALCLVFCPFTPDETIKKFSSKLPVLFLGSFSVVDFHI